MGIVERRDIAIQWHPAVRQRCELRLSLTAQQKRNGRVLQDRLELFGKTVHALTQRSFRGHLSEVQCRSKVGIFPESVDRLKVTFAQTQQGDRARQDVGMTNGTTPQGRDRFRIGRQIGAFVKRPADQAKTRVGGEIRIRLANDESLYQSTCRVSS